MPISPNRCATRSCMRRSTPSWSRRARKRHDQRRRHRMNLLIVDDHPINCKLLRMQLEVAGHRVLVATKGVEALEILDRESVDGVVSDILMPGKNGRASCR